MVDIVWLLKDNTDNAQKRPWIEVQSVLKMRKQSNARTQSEYSLTLSMVNLCGNIKWFVQSS